jgi:hypothetical protein
MSYDAGNGTVWKVSAVALCHKRKRGALPSFRGQAILPNRALGNAERKGKDLVHVWIHEWADWPFHLAVAAAPFGRMACPQGRTPRFREPYNRKEVTHDTYT